jgi:hypothetical protein
MGRGVAQRHGPFFMNAGVSLALPVLTVTMPRTVALLGPGPTSASAESAIPAG